MRQKDGQALIVLVCFAVIATTIIASVVLISITTNSASGRTQEGAVAYSVAESGVENALLRLLRDPSYTGETLAVGSGSAVITVTGTNPKTIVSQGTSGNYYRTLQAVASDSAGILTVTSWKEL
jgi:hypothetical protein